MLYAALVTIYVIICFFLILVVLLQQGKGADIAGAFGGGGSQTAFGARGATTFLHKLTTGAFVGWARVGISHTPRVPESVSGGVRTTSLTLPWRLTRELFPRQFPAAYRYPEWARGEATATRTLAATDRSVPSEACETPGGGLSELAFALTSQGSPQ